jgi:5-methylcytosine-specific restriction endonuclease McrA
VECQRNRGNGFYSKNKARILEDGKAQRLPEVERRRLNRIEEKASKAKALKDEIERKDQERKEYEIESRALAEETDLDTDNFFLGPLCLRNHEWANTGRTALHIIGKGCYHCNVVRGKNRSQDTYEKYLVRTRESRLEKKKEKRDREKDKNKIDFKAYYEKNRQKIIDQKIAYAKTPQGIIASQKSRIKRKGFLDALPVNHTPDQLKIHIESFANTCVYCGGLGDNIDHFIPIVKGGTNNLENLLLACKSCNSSKNASDAYTWYSQRSSFSEERWEYICSRING